MDKQEKTSMLIKEIKDKLDWYISDASDEEYSEKEVEFLQHLLDTLEPMEEGAMPDVDEAWERFWVLAEEKEKNGELFEENNAAGETGNVKATENEVENKVESKKSTKKNRDAKLINFVTRHKAIVAAVLLVVVLAVSMGVQSEAVRNNGFFHWLKYDETGMQMVTSPDSLDGETSVGGGNIYYEREGVPDWAREWVEIEQNTMDEKYEWQYVRIYEYSNRNVARSHYIYGEQTVILGMIVYTGENSINTESFGEYDYVKSIFTDSIELKIYQKEESKEIYYKINFFKNNCYFYVMGGDDLQELLTLAEKYAQMNK